MEEERLEEAKEEKEEAEEELDGEYEESSDTSDTERDDEFEYDDDGNIIIPDVVYDDEEEDAESAEESDEEEDGAENAEESEATSVSAERKDSEAKEESDIIPDERDGELEALRAKLASMESQVKDTLSKLGVDDSDGMAGLVKLAAEAEGISPEEYLKRQAESRSQEDAVQFHRHAMFEQKKRDDLAAVHAAFPSTKKYASVEEFPNFKRFAELRDSGSTPKEAYIASHSDDVSESAAASARQRSLNDTKNHLSSVVPRRAKDSSIVMPKSELARWRDLFPEKSDKEIIDLYKKTSN